MVAHGLQKRLAPTRIGDDVFGCAAADMPARVYGGEVAAQALAAANETVGDDRSAHAIQCTYLLGGDPSKPLRYLVERSRDGRSFSTRRVVAQQDGRDIFLANIGYAIDGAGDAALVHHQAMPAVPSPEDLQDITHQPGMPGRAWADWAAQHPEFEMRPVPANLNDPSGRRQFWCRFRFDEPNDAKVQSVLALYGSDFTMVASVRLPHEPVGEKVFFMTTLNHSLYIHQPYVASGWHLVDHHSPVAAGGRGISLMHVYTPDGLLVATGVQEGLGRRAAAS